jgi:hypothetical protein
MEEKNIKEPSKESKISIGWLVAGILLVVIIVLGVLLGVKGNMNLGSYNLAWSKIKIMNTADAQKKVSDYINNEVLAGKTTAEISDIKEQNGVYIFKVTVQGQSFDSYMSIDGSLLFPEGMAMTSATNANTNTSAEIPKTEKPTAYLFTMSYCPYGNEAEKAMKPVVDLLKDKATIEPHYVIYGNYASNKGAAAEDYCLDSTEKYCSMHGVEELKENVRELCIYRDQKDKFWSYIEKVNANCTVKNIATCWEQQAVEAGINAATVKTCEADEAETLLAKEVELNTRYDISGSPSLVINDTESKASRSAEGYKTAICSGFTTEPAECSQDLSSASTATDTNATCE